MIYFSKKNNKSMKQKTKCYISLILEILILLSQIFFLFMYSYKDLNRKDYIEFMREINYFIYSRKLDPNYMKKFEKVFGDNWDHNKLIKFNMPIMGWFTAFFNFCVGGTLISGVMVNFFSVCENKVEIASFVLFSISSIVIFIELIYSIFGEKTNLDLSEDDLKKFEPIKKLIEENLNDVKKTVLALRICLVIVITFSVIQILLTLFIKNKVRVSSITQTLNSENNEILIKLILFII